MEEGCGKLRDFLRWEVKSIQRGSTVWAPLEWKVPFDLSFLFSEWMRLFVNVARVKKDEKWIWCEDKVDILLITYCCNLGSLLSVTTGCIKYFKAALAYFMDQKHAHKSQRCVTVWSCFIDGQLANQIKLFILKIYLPFNSIDPRKLHPSKKPGMIGSGRFSSV